MHTINEATKTLIIKRNANLSNKNVYMYSIYVHIYMCKCGHTYSLTEWFQRYLYMDIHCNNLTQNNWKQTKNLLMGVKQTSSVTQSTLWDPKDYNPPGSSVHRILKARILEWVAISFSRGSSRPRESALQADSFTVWAIWKALSTFYR